MKKTKLDMAFMVADTNHDHHRETGGRSCDGCFADIRKALRMSIEEIEQWEKSIREADREAAFKDKYSK